MLEIIESGIEMGKFRDDIDVKSLPIFLVASMDGLFLHYLFDNRNFDLKAVTESFLTTFFKGLLKGDRKK